MTATGEVRLASARTDEAVAMTNGGKLAMILRDLTVAAHGALEMMGAGAATERYHR